MKTLIPCILVAICCVANGLPVSQNSGCQSDTIILVDSTGSVKNIFNDQKLYVQKVLNVLDPTTNHVALIVYSSRYRHVKLHGFKDEQTRKSISNLANRISFIGGVTFNGAALTTAIKELENRRPNIPANIVVVTDGFSFDRIEEQIARLRSLNQLRTFAVSIGQFHHRAELLQLAGKPENIFVGPDSADALVKALGVCSEDKKEQNVEKPVQKPEPTKKPESTKKLEPPTNGQKKQPVVKPDVHPPSPTPPINPPVVRPPLVKPEEGNGYDIEPVQPVKKEIPEKPIDKNSEQKPKEQKSVDVKKHQCNLDVIFVLDVSSSTRSAFEEQKSIAVDIYTFLAQTFGIHYAIVKFSGSNRSRIVVPMSENKTTEEFRRSLDSVKTIGGTTYIVKALKQVTELLNNHTADHKVLTILITDGYIHDDPHEDVKTLQSKATVFLVPSAKDFPLNKLEFKRMASQEKYAFLDRNLDSIKSALSEVAGSC